MRRVVNFIICIALICAGIYILYAEVFISYSGRRSKFVAVGLTFIGSGAVWLWFEFLGPIVIRRIIEKRAQSAKSKDAPPI